MYKEKKLKHQCIPTCNVIKFELFQLVQPLLCLKMSLSVMGITSESVL